MSISRTSLLAFVAAMFHTAVLSAQWFQGPALNPAGGGYPNTANYASPPVVTMPAVPTPAALPAPGNGSMPAAPTVGTPSQPAPTVILAPANSPSAPAAPVVHPYNPGTISPPVYVPAPGGAPSPQASPIATPWPQADAAAPAVAPTSAAPTHAVPNYGAPLSVAGGYGSPSAPQSYTLPQYNAAGSTQMPLGQPTYGAAAPAPQYDSQPMPAGNLSQQSMSPFAHPQSPPSQSAWLPTKVASLFPRSWTGNGATTADPVIPPPSYVPYSPGVYDPGVCYGGPSPQCCGNEHWCTNLAIISSFDAFKNGIDLDGQNANFGRRVGAFGGIPLLPYYGIGAELGYTAGWYDWKGSQYTGPDDRFQQFVTAGVFQRPCQCGIVWGIVHDWLYDDFYADMRFSQFRGAVGFQLAPGCEIGVWATLPQARDETFVGTPAVLNRFETLTQYNLYWQQAWSDCAWSNVFIGAAEDPGDITYGCNAQVAVTRWVALTGGMEYVLPGSGSSEGRQEEIWNLSFGIALYPGTAMQTARSRYRPLLPMADNGNMAVFRQ